MASSFVILHDLTLSNNEQFLNHPVLGTKIEDFFQIYLGNVHLKGSLTIGNIKAKIDKTQILINDQLVNTAVGYHFWMKHMEQVLLLLCNTRFKITSNTVLFRILLVLPFIEMSIRIS